MNRLLATLLGRSRPAAERAAGPVASNPRFLVFQHLRAEGPGHFRDCWQTDGIAWDAVIFEDGAEIPSDLDRYQALVVMGGPMHAWEEECYPWLAAEKRAIRHFVKDLGRPYLGICLGHQLLAEAIGGSVALAKKPEVGLVPIEFTPDGWRDPLLSGLAGPLQVFQWHDAEVTSLPPEATLLATSRSCRHQAFRWGRAYGLQWHPEITRSAISDWQTIAEYRSQLEAALGPGGATRLAQETLTRLPSIQTTALRLHQNFLAAAVTSQSACTAAPKLKINEESSMLQTSSREMDLSRLDLTPPLKLHSKEVAEAFVAKLREQGIEYLRFEMADMAGMSRGKTIPIDHVAGYMRKGLNLYGGTVALDSYSIPVRNSGYNEERNYSDCVMIVDTETLSPVPWLEKTSRVICDTMWYDGKVQLAAPRMLLKKMLKLADALGYDVMMAHEYEFYVVDAKTRQPLFPGQPIFSTARTHQNAAIDELIRIYKAQGIDIITYNVEHGPGQVEINYTAQRGVAAADRSFIFKNSTKEFLHQRGLLATFMTKPYKGLSGSCSHYHISLLNKETKKNAFLDAAEPNGMSESFKHFIQGVLDHARASMAIWSPTPNCYRRIRPRTYAPSNISWGVEDRSASVRVKASRDEGEHMEVRVPAAMSNPYLVAASVIASGLLGIIEKRPLMSTGDGPKEDNADFKKLPTEIYEALDALEADASLRNLLGEEFIQVYLAMKRQEAGRLRDEIPEAEVREYFDAY